ncbi:MAG TPA: NAD(P)/FAD-dependent oxidoreductase [Candidatus Merdivicinus faecavium]|nr:NAD(P)/FAD-dependent oxidoreductase [Candidatus Merdivicinus faecavium]
MNQTDLIVIGAGPAGMMAAITAAQRGKSVLLLERNPRPGRKLLITGKGRCNVTNNCGQDALLANIPRNPRFLYSAFARFSTADTIAFFESRGLPLKTERGSRVFPQSDRAADVLAVLERALRELNVPVINARVSSLLIDEEQKTVLGVRCGDGREFRAAATLLACGGMSYPQTGSTGDGYALAAQAGHRIIPPVPSLIPILTEEKEPREMQGLSLKNVTLTVYRGEKPVFSELGELLFTHFGVSGPLVLSASAHMEGQKPEGPCTAAFCATMLKGKGYRLSIDWKPGLSEEQLDRRLLRDFAKFQNKDAVNSLGELLPRKAIPVLLRRAGIPLEEKVNRITKEQRRRLLETLKGYALTPVGFRPIEEAIITSGGVDVREVNPKTMASKLASGLYFAGELLDVDGYTGGFNLQIAFATGVLAGEGC